MTTCIILKNTVVVFGAACFIYPSLDISWNVTVSYRNCWPIPIPFAVQFKISGSVIDSFQLNKHHLQGNYIIVLLNYEEMSRMEGHKQHGSSTPRGYRLYTISYTFFSCWLFGTSCQSLYPTDSSLRVFSLLLLSLTSRHIFSGTSTVASRKIMCTN